MQQTPSLATAMCVKIKRCELRYATKGHKSNLRDRKKVNTKKKMLVTYRNSAIRLKADVH
jgi:hypothetical protein